MIKYLLVMFVLVSCNNGASTPEGLLKKFVKDAVSGKVDREYYQEYSTGSLLQASETLTEEEMKNTIMANISNPKVKVLSKNCNGNTCVLTYLVSYSTKEEKKTIFSSEVKKMAEIVKEGENWKLAEVKNLKTYHESNETIKITPKEK